MAGLNTLITASDYNAIQSKVALVLGSGSSDFGYGQVVSSAQVSQYAKVSVAQWNNLRLDLLKARQHQTSSDISASLTTPTTSVKIYEADRAAYMAMADAATADRLIVPPSGQATRENLVTTQVRTTNWNGTLTQTITVNFTDANAMRYYFNTGSRFEFSSSRAGGSNTQKDIAWTTILTNMGVIYFNRASTTCTGAGNTSSIGYTGLTTSDQLIFSKDVSDSSYVPNQFRLNARAPSATQMVFTLQWADASSLGSNPSYPQFAIDEDVTGTLTSLVQVYRASGGVSVATPSASTTGI